MNDFAPINLQSIILNDVSYCGHMVYKNAIYKPGANSKKIVFKRNKRNKGECSRMEAALSGLARLFLRPHSTSPQVLVMDNNQMVGLASEHLCYSIRECEGDRAAYYLIANDTKISNPKTYTTEDIPICFFADFPRGFFAKLIANKDLILDMDSLASVLGTAYTLEEDDLHKGNFGFYIVKKNDKPHVVFFKIDHDLMMADSIMSRHYGHARITHMHHGRNAFSISQYDLLSFPKLKSKNYYWPTTRRYIVNPFGSRVYSNVREIEAFAALNNNPEFQKARWLVFYKHVLIPPLLIEQGLEAGYPKKEARYCAQNAMITNAVVARQAYLRAVLFSTKPFRQFLIQLNSVEKMRLLKEILVGVKDNALYAQLEKELINTIFNHQRCVLEDFVADDTPLHAAIRLNDYRFNESLQHFRQFMNRPNKEGQTAIDLACTLSLKNNQTATEDVRANPLLVAKHLEDAGAKQSKFSKIVLMAKGGKGVVAHYQYCRQHIKAVSDASNYHTLLKAFRAIGKDYSLPLKMKKELSLYCLYKFIKNQEHNPNLYPMLLRLKQGLDGGAFELQYIRQLRSELWIVRQIRGMLGGTSTQVAMINLIDSQLKHLAKYRQPTFFSDEGNNETFEMQQFPIPVY